VDVMREESEGVKRSAKSFLTINRGSRWLRKELSVRVWKRCVNCVCVCVCVDRLMRSLESVPTMLGVPPLLHNRRFAQAPVNSSKDMESGNPGRTLGRR
jgi:hypothetical protein